jgi:hypothetical protein
MQHLSGRILKPSLGKHFETEWTSSLADTRVSPLVQQESDLEQTTRDTSGLLLQKEFGFFNQDCASLKTSKDISAWGCPTSSKTWEDWVTEQRGAYSARLNAVRLTNASECLFSQWPTTAARDYKGCGNAVDRKDGKHRLDTLEAVVLYGHPAPVNLNTDGSRLGSWPTPNSQPAQWKLINGKNQSTKTGQIYGTSIAQSVQQWQTATVSTGAHRQKDGSMTDKLDQQVKTWATPRACEAENPPMGLDKRHHGLTHQVTKTWATPRSRDAGDWMMNKERLAAGKPEDTLTGQATQSNKGNGKLNPRWVEILMNLPIGWTMPSCALPVTIAPTNSASSETELCQPPPL